MEMSNASHKRAKSCSPSPSAAEPAVPPASAAISVPRDFFLDNLKCSICLDLFTAPCVTVPCSHQFCEQCLSSWFHLTRKCSCPICRSKVYMVTEAPKITESLLSVYVAAFPLPTESESRPGMEEKNTPSVRIKKNVPLKRYHAGLFQEGDEEEEEEDDDFSDSDEEEAQPVINGALQAAVSSEMVALFVQLTGATEDQARRTISGALVRGLSMDHAVEYYLVHGM